MNNNDSPAERTWRAWGCVVQHLSMLMQAAQRQRESKHNSLDFPNAIPNLCSQYAAADKHRAGHQEPPLKGACGSLAVPTSRSKLARGPEMDSSAYTSNMRFWAVLLMKVCLMDPTTQTEHIDVTQPTSASQGRWTNESGRSTLTSIFSVRKVGDDGSTSPVTAFSTRDKRLVKDGRVVSTRATRPSCTKHSVHATCTDILSEKCSDKDPPACQNWSKGFERWRWYL